MNYLEHIRRFVEVFPKDQIFVMIYEDFKKDNLGFLKKILKFLDVDENFQPSTRIANKNKTIRFRPFYYLIQSHGIKRIFWKILNIRTYFFIKRIVDKIFYRYEERKELDPRLLSELKKESMPLVQAFNEYLHKEQLTRIDLIDLWGYST
jgi:hypothetical protein